MSHLEDIRPGQSLGIVLKNVETGGGGNVASSGSPVVRHICLFLSSCTCVHV